MVKSFILYQQANNNKLLYIYILLYICFVQINYSLGQDSNYVKLYNEKGILSSEGFLVNNLPEGEWISYYSNGQIKSKGSWKANQLNGEWAFYNIKGILIKEEQYINNEKNGKSNTYDSLGLLKKSSTYKNNNKNGQEEIKFKNSNQTQFQYNYLNNQKNGLSKEYDSSGNIISLINYDMGIIIKKEEINRYDSDLKKHGIWKTFYPNNKIKSKQTFFHGELNGATKIYNKNGGVSIVVNDQKKEEKNKIKTKISKTKNKEGFTIKGVIKNNIKNGLFKVYDENNKIIKKEFYKNDTIVFSGFVDTLGAKNGLWIYYYQNGEIKKQGHFDNNKKKGEWVFYYRNKVIEQKGNYINGKPEGLWTWWYENEKIRRKEEYRRGKVNGKVIEYDSIGNVITEGNYIEGIKEGSWKYIYNDYEEVGFFADGMKTGKWKAKYVNGNTYFDGEFLNDIPINEHIYYYSNGKKKEEGSFLRGEKNGDWKKYNEEGTLIITTQYKNGEEYKIDGLKINRK
ncbi:MAG: hypothetical protein CL846_06040 [Crocinitomicaceae bacterium]|nr:hypothetical protein [Crocinitomicaceae bacterium]